MNKVNVYVDTDGKLHYMNRNGADSVLPFSKGIEPIYQYTVINSSSSLTKPMTKGKIYIITTTLSKADQSIMGVYEVSDGTVKVRHVYGYSSVNITGNNIVINNTWSWASLECSIIEI